MPNSSLRLAATVVLLVRDLLQPLDVLAVKRFLNRDVRHCSRRCRAVPVFMTRRAPDHIARADLDARLAFALRPPASRRDEQRLTERMRMPRSARSRFKSHGG